MSTDARLSTGLPAHPKTKKLIRRVGEGGAWALVCLILWARANRPDGDFEGMTSEDIELAVDWRGEADALVSALVSVGFLDGEEGAYRLHDWTDHQPWSNGSELRSLKAKWNAVKRHHGPAEADRQVPEYAAIRATSIENGATSMKSDASSSATAMLSSNADSTKIDAPSPSPSPSPSPKAKAEELLSPPKAGDSPSPPADLPSRKAARMGQIAAEAQEAYNRILAKPNGLLTACTVLNKPRLKAVEKCIPTAKLLCKAMYGSERVVPQFWEDYFTEAAGDDFHAGRGPYRPPHENWRPDFEFLLREDVMAKLFDRAQSADAGGVAA
ncbi:hypothetical protein [Thermomonas mangrovi]|uniref:hypothetical protein n=1 Tax=Thermomonas mangrovi TaxID=2993316 RepID=UPI002307492B|nr:hypothetical protein [Thermomonas mangrovi]